MTLRILLRDSSGSFREIIQKSGPDFSLDLPAADFQFGKRVYQERKAVRIFHLQLPIIACSFWLIKFFANCSRQAVGL